MSLPKGTHLIFVMNQLTIRPATLEDRTLIRSISERTWPSTYGHIISKEQIDFMFYQLHMEQVQVKHY